MPIFEPILGRYFDVDLDGATHRIFVEEAGQGIPLLCLHTAGADSRQYRHVLNDAAVTSTYRVIAFSTKGRGGETITPATGAYVEEVQSAGPPLPIWEEQG